MNEENEQRACSDCNVYLGRNISVSRVSVHAFCSDCGSETIKKKVSNGYCPTCGRKQYIIRSQCKAGGALHDWPTTTQYIVSQEMRRTLWEKLKAKLI